MTGKLLAFPIRHHLPAMPTLHSIMAQYETRIVAAVLDSSTPEGNETLDYIGQMMAFACHPKAPANFDSLFEFVAIAHGLHAAADAIRPADASRGDEMASLGQLFLAYAISDIGNLMSASVAEALGLH